MQILNPMCGAAATIAQPPFFKVPFRDNGGPDSREATAECMKMTPPGVSFQARLIATKGETP